MKVNIVYAIVLIAVIMIPSAFAEHSMNAIVENAQGSSTSGCEPDCFIPSIVTIGVGGQVTFVNNDTASHTASAGNVQDGLSDPGWDSSLVMPGQSYTTPELAAGEYPYWCMVHPWMTGLVIVEEQGHDDHSEIEMEQTLTETSSTFDNMISVEIDSTNYNIEYTGNNAILKSATADLEAISIFFETEISNAEGDITINFQRDFFDAKIGTQIDDDFWILADGEEINFEESKTDVSRTLSFSISSGTQEIEIIGTVLATYSYLISQEQQVEDDAKAEADAKAKAEADAKAKAEAKADAEAKAEADAKLAEEQRLENLANTCGDGTVFENGECVLSPMAKNASDTRTGPLIYSIVIGMSLGIIIMLILWGIGKRSHKVLSDEDS